MNTYYNINISNNKDSLDNLGLRNLGNTCFFNSIIQALSSLHPFRYLLEQIYNYLSPDDSIDLINESGVGNFTKLLYDCLEHLNNFNSGTRFNINQFDINRKQYNINILFDELNKYHPKKSILHGSRRVYKQQDVHETLQDIFDILEKEYSEATSGFRLALRQNHFDFGHKSPNFPSSPLSTRSNTTPSPFIRNGTPGPIPEISSERNFRNPFSGMVGKIITCDDKFIKSYRQESFLDLTLPLLEENYNNNNNNNNFINKFNNIKKKRNINDLLFNKFSKIEEIEGLSCQRCSERAKNDAKIRLEGERLIRTAEIGIDAMNKKKEKRRWERKLKEIENTDYKLIHKCKINISRLPEILCFHLTRRNGNSIGYNNKIQDHIEFPKILYMSPYFHSFSKKTLNNKNKKSLPYKLRAVIVHLGLDGESGHYVTYRCLDNDIDNNDYIWVEANDHNMKEVSWDYVKNSQAYMLFYQADNSEININNNIHYNNKLNELKKNNNIEKNLFDDENENLFKEEEKNEKNKELKENDIKEINIKENDRKENDIKTNNLKNENEKENDIKTNNIKEINIKENDRKENDIKTNNLKNENEKEIIKHNKEDIKENDFKEKEIIINKNEEVKKNKINIEEKEIINNNKNIKEDINHNELEKNKINEEDKNNINKLNDEEKNIQIELNKHIKDNNIIYEIKDNKNNINNNENNIDINDNNINYKNHIHNNENKQLNNNINNINNNKKKKKKKNKTKYNNNNMNGHVITENIKLNGNN